MFDVRSGFDIGVAAAVVTNSSILLVQEAKGTYAGCWGLPKGYVEPNESIEAAVLRELKEETNIEGSISGFIGLRTTKTQHGVGLFFVTKSNQMNLQFNPKTMKSPMLDFLQSRSFPILNGFLSPCEASQKLHSRIHRSH